MFRVVAAKAWYIPYITDPHTAKVVAA
jgi:hypothetical protein